MQVLSSKTPPELEDDDDAEYDLFDEQLKQDAATAQQPVVRTKVRRCTVRPHASGRVPNAARSAVRDIGWS